MNKGMIHFYGNVNRAMGQNNKSFVDVITSAKGITLEDDLDGEEEFVPKKEPSAIVATTHKGIVNKPARVPSILKLFLVLLLQES